MARKMTMEEREALNKRVFNTEKQEAIQVAKDLCYKSYIIEQIRTATTSIQIEKALRKGRAMM